MIDDYFIKFEEKVMKMLLNGENEILKLLQKQYSSIEILKREFSGVGFFTTFKVNNKNATIPNLLSFNFGDVIGEIENVKNGVSFLLFIKDGLLDMLEGYTYDEKWPDKITKYHLKYVSGDRRDLIKLKEKWQ